MPEEEEEEEEEGEYVPPTPPLINVFPLRIWSGGEHSRAPLSSECTPPGQLPTDSDRAGRECDGSVA